MAEVNKVLICQIIYDKSVYFMNATNSKSTLNQEVNTKLFQIPYEPEVFNCDITNLQYSC